MKTHFKSLTEIRGLACLAVLVSHIDQFHYLYNTKHLGITETKIADYAVTMFFVLSGFLITYLLVSEWRTTSTIDIKKFYIRRVLRIWPVYYMTLGISALLIFIRVIEPPANIFLSTVFFGGLLPNLGYTLFLATGTITPLWSIGVEEQFYAIWPWVVKLEIPLFKGLLGIAFIYIVVKIGIYLYHPTGGLYFLITLTRIDCMAIGGIFANLYINKSKFVNFSYSKTIQLVSALIVISPCFYTADWFGNLENEIYATACGFVILNSATNENSFLKLNSYILKFFGVISYGIYCYHMTVFFVMPKILVDQHIVIVFCVIILLTTAMAYCSYIFIEKKLLKYKDRFSVIATNE